MASTKAFLAQITACYILGLYLAQLRGGSQADEAQAVIRDLQAIPAKIETLLGRLDRVREIARFMADTRSVLLLWPFTLASRWRWKARSSSRSCGLHSRRGGSRPVNSSTARSR